MCRPLLKDAEVTRADALIVRAHVLSSRHSLNAISMSLAPLDLCETLGQSI